MSMFTMQEMESLTELGYNGCFVEDIREGDEIALHNLGHYRDGEPRIKFVTVARLTVLPRDGSSGPLMQFIGVHPSGLREPMAYGAGYEAFRKEEAA